MLTLTLKLMSNAFRMFMLIKSYGPVDLMRKSVIKLCFHFSRLSYLKKVL